LQPRDHPGSGHRTPLVIPSGKPRLLQRRQRQPPHSGGTTLLRHPPRKTGAVATRTGRREVGLLQAALAIPYGESRTA